MKLSYSLVDVNNFLNGGDVPKQLDVNKLRSFKRYAKRFQVKGNKLMYRYMNKAVTGEFELRVVVLTEDEKRLVFEELHSTDKGIHVGINSTRKNIADRYYWRSMNRDIRNLIKDCNICKNSKELKALPPEHSQLSSGESRKPWKMLGIEIHGPLPKSKEGNSYILVVADLWGKYVDAFPINSKCAEAVVGKLKSLFYRFGLPRKILSNEQRDFCKELNLEVCCFFNMRHLVVCQSLINEDNDFNLSEVLITSVAIKEVLNKLIVDHWEDWDHHLAVALLSIRTPNENYEKTCQIAKIPSTRRLISSSARCLTPSVTQRVPKFSGQAVVNGDFQMVGLDDFKGKYLVLFFYPLDFTFVCPTELIAFSDRIAEFKSLDCEVVGVSTDSHFSHLAWINQPRQSGGLGGLQYPLLSDFNKSISKDYGVLLEEDGIALRGLFLIDPQGILKHMSVNDLPVGRSVDETLRLIKAFKFVEEHGEVCPANWQPESATIKPDPRGSREYFEKANWPSQ